MKKEQPKKELVKCECCRKWKLPDKIAWEITCVPWNVCWKCHKFGSPKYKSVEKDLAHLREMGEKI